MRGTERKSPGKKSEDAFTARIRGFLTFLRPRTLEKQADPEKLNKLRRIFELKIRCLKVQKPSLMETGGINMARFLL